VRALDRSSPRRPGEGNAPLVISDAFNQVQVMVALRTQMMIAAQPTRSASGGRGLRVFG